MNNLEPSHDNSQKSLEQLQAENNWLKEKFSRFQLCHNQLSDTIGENNLINEEFIQTLLPIIAQYWESTASIGLFLKMGNTESQTINYQPSTIFIRKEITQYDQVIGYIEANVTPSINETSGTRFDEWDEMYLAGIAIRLSNFMKQDIRNSALRSKENMLSDLLDNINDVIYTTDELANITYISPSIQKLLGYTQEDVVGKNFTLFIGNKGDQLKARFEEIQKNFGLKNEYQIPSKTGEYHWIRFSSKAIFKEGQFKGVTGVLIDVSETKKIELELQRSEALYRSILHASPDTIFIADLDGTVRFSSPMAIKMFGYEGKKFPLHQSLFNFLHPKDHEKARSAIGEMFSGNFNGATEYTGIKLDGSTLEMEVNGEFIRDSEGNPTSMVFVARDISDRKNAEKRLLKSEETYRKLVESINDIVFDIAMDGTIKYVSPSIKKLINLSPEQLIGNSFFNYVYPPDKDRLIQVFKNNLFDTFKHIDYRCQSPEGEIFWVQVSAQFTYENGQIVGRSGILHDITEQKIAEENLRKSEEQYRRLFESVNDVIYEVDKMGFIKLVSPSVIRVLGYSVEEVLGRNIFDFIHPEDVPVIRETLMNLDAKDYHYMEYRYLRKDGTIHWVRSSTSSLFENGVMVGGTGILTDITERKITQEALVKSEERFVQIAEQSKIAIWEVDAKGLYTYVNPLAEKIWGYSSEEIIGKMHFYDLHPHDGREEFKVQALAAMHAKEKFTDFANQIITRDQQIIWVATNGVPVVDKQNQLIGYRGADTDITERLIAEQALKRSENELNEAQKIAQMCSWELNVITHQLSWSENYYRIMGIPFGKEMKTEFFLSKVHPDDLPLIDAKYQELQLTGKAVQYDLRVLMPNNRYNWIQNNIVPEFINDKLVNLRGVNIDVTHKKIDEEKIKIQNEKLNAIITAIPDLIFVMSKDGVYLEVFATEVNKLLIEPDKIIGLNIRDAFTPDMAIYFLRLIDRSLETKEMVSANYVIALPESSSTHFEARIVPMYDDKVLILSRDVTEQAKNEQEIKKLSMVVEQSPVITMITDLDGTIEYVNPVFETITGYQPHEVVGKKSELFFSDKTDPIVNAKICESIHRSKEWHGEWIQKKKNGEDYWEDVAISTILDTEGIPINYLIVKQDITQRKETEKILRKSEESYRQMFGNNPQPMWIYDLETLSFLEVNDAAIRHYGYSRSDFLAMTLRDIRPQEDIPALLKDVELSKNHQNIAGEWRHLKKNGELIYVEIASHAVTFNNREARHILVKDITERKRIEKEIRDLNANLEHKIEDRTKQLNLLNKNLIQEIEYRKRTESALVESEKSYRMVVENVNEIFYKTNILGEWLFLNKSWETVTGYTVLESIGKNCLHYVYQEDSPALENLFRQLIKGEVDQARMEIRYLNNKGECRWLETFCRPAIDEKGLITGTYGTLQDITERKKSNELIQKARLEAEQANQAKSEFLSRMSHELRTPMNSILGFAQLLELGDLTSKQRKGVDHILKSGRHLLQLINEVLDISRIEAGHLVINQDTVDIQKLNQEVVDIMAPIAAEKEIKLEILNHIKDNYFLLTDSQRIKQVMLNLTSNAIKYNRIGGSVVIESELQFPKDNTEGRIKISVTDTGFGIADEDLPHIFTPFERIGAERSGVEGTGLGLAVVNKLVKALEGKVGVESSPGEGSKFWIELPARSGNGMPGPQKQAKSETDYADKGGTILYIEDNQSNFELVEHFLAFQRPEIQLITNIYGKMAVPLAVKYTPDLILIDLNLPDIDGKKVLELLMIEPRTSHIPIVVVSADAMPERLDLLMKAGARQYLTKPFNLEEMLGVVDKYLPIIKHPN